MLEMAGDAGGAAPSMDGFKRSSDKGEESLASLWRCSDVVVSEKEESIFAAPIEIEPKGIGDVHPGEACIPSNYAIAPTTSLNILPRSPRLTFRVRR